MRIKKQRISIHQNLKQDLDANLNEIQTILDGIKHEGSFYDYVGMFRNYEVDSALSCIQKKIYNKYKVIFSDYDTLLSRKDLKLLLSHIETIEEIVDKEFSIDNVDLSVPYVWKDVMNVAHETTEEERRNEYIVRLNDFSHQLFLQKIRTQNAFRRRQKEKHANQFAVWAPLIVSIFALIVSIIGIYISINTGVISK